MVRHPSARFSVRKWKGVLPCNFATILPAKNSRLSGVLPTIRIADTMYAPQQPWNLILRLCKSNLVRSLCVVFLMALFRSSGLSAGQRESERRERVLAEAKDYLTLYYRENDLSVEAFNARWEKVEAEILFKGRSVTAAVAVLCACC
jgi:hypothetical protein